MARAWRSHVVVLSLPPAVRVFVARGATDMRKSFDTLAALVCEVVAEDPQSGLPSSRGRTCTDSTRGPSSIPEVPLMYLDEDAVQNAVACFLPTISYSPTQLRSRRQHGVDIKARHTKYSRYFEIEVKGEPGRGTKSPQSGRETRFLQALGQLLTRIHPERDYRYGIAFPITYKDLVRRRVAPSLVKRLRLSFFFVDEKGRVEHMQWKDLEAQHKKAA